LHMLRGCFQEYAVMNRGYPPNTIGTNMPTGMATFFPKYFDWAARTPLGGRWNWDGSKKSLYGWSFEFGLVAEAAWGKPLASPSFFLQVDQQIDDGNLNTGSFRFRTGSSGSGYVYVLQEGVAQPYGVKP